MKLWTVICICLILTTTLGLDVACNGLHCHTTARLVEVLGLVAAGLYAMTATESL